MVKKHHHISHFKITQYAFALLIGVIAALVAPKEVKLDIKRRSWPLTDQSVQASSTAWWRIKKPKIKTTHDLKPWVEYRLTSKNKQNRFHSTYTLTKNDFRCRGRAERAPQTVEEQGTKSYLFDCWGSDHGLPWTPFNQKELHTTDQKRFEKGHERVQPALIEILNALQQSLQNRIIITSGHRCLQHHRYITHNVGPNLASNNDKHLIAASADFYIENSEEKPDAIVKRLDKICKERAFLLPKEKASTLISKGSNLWSNSEIELRYWPAGELRNLDNDPQQAYYEISVRYDYQLQQDVKFNPKLSSALPLY